METAGISAAPLLSLGSGMLNTGNNALNQVISNGIKFRDYIRFAREVGATPAAIAQGLVGTAGGNSPGFANSIPDLGASLNNAVSADASQKQALAAQDEAAAARTRAETERQLGLMRLRFEPQKYMADIRKSLSEAFKSTKEAFLHGSMKKYYDELTTDVQKVRPWKLAGLAQGLLNDMATYNKIVQETNTSKAQEGYYKSASTELDTRADLNRANTSLTYSQSLNESLKGFRLQWENSLLSNGIDPNKPFWENTARLMYSDPKLFNKRMDMFINSIQMIDGRIQDNLGEHYKRNIMLGVGAYQFNKLHQKNANMRNYRFNNTLRSISSFIPFTNSSSSMPSVGVSGPGVDWWLKD